MIDVPPCLAPTFLLLSCFFLALSSALCKFATAQLPHSATSQLCSCPSRQLCNCPSCLHVARSMGPQAKIFLKTFITVKGDFTFLYIPSPCWFKPFAQVSSSVSKHLLRSRYHAWNGHLPSIGAVRAWHILLRMSCFDSNADA